MKDRLPFMPWFPRDFMSSTRGWTVTERGVYRELLDAQWDIGILPLDPSELCRLIGAGPSEWSAGWAKCEHKFPAIEGGRRNSRLETHRAKAFKVSEVRKEIGRRGGQASAAARAEPIGQAIATDASRTDMGGDLQAIAAPIAQAKVNHPNEDIREEKNKNPAARVSLSETRDEDPDDYLIWTAGIELLGESKRSLMGKLVKTHGRDLVARKLGELMAMPEKPRDPAAYFIGVMRKFERRFQA